jgi:GT2 family glycosyltransferase
MNNVQTFNDDTTTPMVFILILNYNSFEDTAECVRSVEALHYPRISVVIIDNASPNGSGILLQQTFTQHTVILSDRNGGFAAGNNIGIRYALEHNADYIFIVNDDATVTPDILNHMVGYAEKHADVGLLSARVYFPGTTELFAAAGRFNRLLCTGQNYGAIQIEKNETDHLKYVDYACGVLWLVRSEVFRTVGLMDEKYFMYFEDLEFSLRVLKSYKMVYIPDAVAYHKTGSGKGWRNYSELYLYYHTRNRFWVFEHSSWLYKVYVTVFITVNSMAKSILILQNMGDPAGKATKQLKALWKGWRDGLYVFLNLSNGSQQQS